MLQREQYMVQDKHGGRHFPSKAGTIIMMVFVIGFVILWMAVAQSTFGALFGMLFTAVAVVICLVRIQKADQYERRRRQYERRRGQVLREIDSRSP
jgi:uncharacterized membrane protein (DUF485 family)